MKVLNVIPYFGVEFGGPPVNVLNMAAHLKLQHVENSIITTKITKTIEEKMIEQKVSGQIVGVLVVSCPAIGRGYRFSLSFISKFKKMADISDVVLIHGLWQFPCSYAAWWCRRNRIPYFIFTHAMLAKYSFRQKKWKKKVYFYAFERRNMEQASGVFFMDSEEMEFAKELGFRGRGFLAFSALNEEDIIDPYEVAGSYSQDYEKDGNRFNILFMGRIHPKKGLEYLIGAVSRLFDEYPRMRLLIAGPVEDEKYFKKVKQMTKKYERDGKILYLGALTGESKKRFLKSGDVFVLPSHDDSQPVALLEAMAAALPVIVTPGCKMPEIHNQMGYVVTLSPEAIAEALKMMIQNRKLAREMGCVGQQYVLQNFMWSKRIDEILTSAKKVIS